MYMRSIFCSLHSSRYLATREVRSRQITKWDQGSRNLFTKYLSAKLNRENGVGNCGKEGHDTDIMIIIEMYTRDTQSHWALASYCRSTPWAAEQSAMYSFWSACIQQYPIILVLSVHWVCVLWLSLKSMRCIHR